MQDNTRNAGQLFETIDVHAAGLLDVPKGNAAVGEPSRSRVHRCVFRMAPPATVLVLKRVRGDQPWRVARGVHRVGNFKKSSTTVNNQQGGVSNLQINKEVLNSSIGVSCLHAPYMDAPTDAIPEQGISPHPIPAFIGPLVQSRHTTPCPTYFEISFLDSKRTQRLDAIVFRNFYCSHITIKRRRQRFDPEIAATSTAAAGSGIDGDPWMTILRDRPLMENPHHEDDAQYWHVVTADEFDREEYDADSTAPLRIYLYQPSPMWKTIGLHHVKVVSWSSAGSNGAEEDATLVRNSGRRETDGHLGDLCRGISEQVEIFGDKRRLRQTP